MFDADKTRMVKKLGQYVKPFSSNTGTLRTDRRTNGQNCYINIVTHDKNRLVSNSL